MRRLELFVFAGLVFAGMARAQTTATTQTTASSSTQVTGAGQRGLQAQASSSASASESAQSSSRKGKGGGASTATNASAFNSNSAAASAGPAAVQLNDRTAVNAVLVNSLDARKCKPGDKIEARTTSDVKQDGRVVLKKGSRLQGHVTEAQARSKVNAESALGIVFDSVTLKNGEQAPLHLRVQALRAASSETSAAIGDDEGTIASGASAVGSGRVGGGLLGGAGAAVGGAAGTAGNVTGNAGRAAGGTVGATTHAGGSATSSAGGLDTAGHLTSSSSGVFGFEGLSLASAANSGTQASVVSSKTRNVHLDSGTQMVLRATMQ
jgi:hypothetical protein